MTGRAADRRPVARALAALAAAAAVGWAASAPGAFGAAPAPAGSRAALPRSALAVRTDGVWTTWWRSASAPARWAAPDATVLAAARWRRAAPGVESGELRLAGSGEAWRLRVRLVRLDPAQVRVTLAGAVAGPPGARRPAWSVDSAPNTALLAVNAGQFAGARPWGWLVHAGREYRPPGRGPLAPAVVVDSAGRLTVVPADGLAAVRSGGAAARARGLPSDVREAFQSYPALLAGGVVPEALRARGRGVDVAHRDARLALGTLPDGRVLVALTRFDPLGGPADAAAAVEGDGPGAPPLDALPFGPTAPEMAALMGALGCRDAVLLDGGVSGQMLTRDAAGGVRRWRGLRRVPLGLVVTPRG